jgi:hypothetical protein
LVFNNIKLQTLLSAQLFVVRFGIRCSISGFGQLFDVVCSLSKMYHHILPFLQAKARNFYFKRTEVTFCTGLRVHIA